MTIPGEFALEAIALLNGNASLLADLRLDGEPQAFYAIQDMVWKPLLDALGYHGEEDLGGPVWDSYEDQSHFYEENDSLALGRPGIGCDRDDEDGARHHRSEGTAGVQLCLSKHLGG